MCKLCAGVEAFVTNPLDVAKTRIMLAKVRPNQANPGRASYRTVQHCVSAGVTPHSELPFSSVDKAQQRHTAMENRSMDSGDTHIHSVFSTAQR